MVPLDPRRVMDVVLGSMLLVAVTPVLAAAGVWMRLSGDRGPFLFRSPRMGAGGRPFEMMKLRTMRPGVGGPGVTVGDDSRITPVGRTLRRYRIDELPQLVNVVRGQMSLVGPRPEDPRYVDLDDPLHRTVFAVRPGITGPTQLAFRDEAELLDGPGDPEQLYRAVILPAKLRMDAEYLARRTIATDLGLLRATVTTILGRGRPGSATATVPSLRDVQPRTGESGPGPTDDHPDEEPDSQP
jgi:lipopolysaccharide/colanic/teichoic acid biosynthesis glycosyltransferase